MKKLRLYLLLGAILCCILVFAGCGPKTLDRPTGVRVDTEKMELAWDEVENARVYSVEINGEADATHNNPYSISKLKAGEYEFRVKALGDGDAYADSDWSEPVTFVKEAETGLVYTLIADGAAYEVTGAGTAKGNVEIGDTYRGKPVVSIADSALSGSQLTGVVIGSNVTKIGRRAFYNCSAMTSVVIPESVTSIGAYAFQSCRALETVAVPSGVTALSEYTFAYCKGLKSVALSEGISSIGAYAFHGCERLESILLPDSLNRLGEKAFSECKSVKSLSTGAGLREIPEYAFYECASLTKVDFGENTFSIGAYAFSDCTALAEIDIPDGVSAVGDCAFYNCAALGTVKIGSAVRDVGALAFGGTKLWSDAEELVFADKWLVGCKNLKIASVSVPEGTEGIGDYAFYQCGSFTAVALPDSVLAVGDYAFCQSVSLMSADLGENVEKIGEYAFYGCSILSTVSYGGNLRTIGSYAFEGCERLSSVSLPDTVESIGTYSFHNTAMWKNSGGVVYADNWVVGCTSVLIGSVALRAGTVGIGNYAINSERDFRKTQQKISNNIENSLQMIA